jgi:hypothetical protein
LSEIKTFTENEFETLGLNTRDNQAFGLTESGNVARRVIDPDGYVLLESIVSAIENISSSGALSIIDGGSSESVYLVTQELDGGSSVSF